MLRSVGAGARATAPGHPVGNRQLVSLPRSSTAVTVDYTRGRAVRRGSTLSNLAILLLCSGLAFGQNTSPPTALVGKPPADSVDRKPGHGCRGNLEILSDTRGIDFGSYLQRILRDIRSNWYKSVPESAELKKGNLAIEFALRKDGKVADMRLTASSGDVALDHAGVERHR